jgi:hypothetical protein
MRGLEQFHFVIRQREIGSKSGGGEGGHWFGLELVPVLFIDLITAVKMF